MSRREGVGCAAPRLSGGPRPGTRAEPGRGLKSGRRPLPASAARPCSSEAFHLPREKALCSASFPGLCAAAPSLKGPCPTHVSGGGGPERPRQLCPPLPRTDNAGGGAARLRGLHRPPNAKQGLFVQRGQWSLVGRGTPPPFASRRKQALPASSGARTQAHGEDDTRTPTSLPALKLEALR